MTKEQELIQKAYERMDAESAAYLKGEEVAADKRLNDAREGVEAYAASVVSPSVPVKDVLRPVRDHSGALCWPPFHDPRGECRWLKESGLEPPPEEIVAPEQLDAHVKEHMRIKTVLTDFDLVLRKAWMHRTGEQRSVIEIKGGEGIDGAELAVRVDHNAAAAKYLEDTHRWSELLWPVVMAIGDGTMTRDQWGNRIPTWPTAHRLWHRFAPALMRRLERLPFAAYVAELEKVAAYSGSLDDLRTEAARLAEIDAKYTRR